MLAHLRLEVTTATGPMVQAIFGNTECQLKNSAKSQVHMWRGGTNNVFETHHHSFAFVTDEYCWFRGRCKSD